MMLLVNTHSARLSISFLSSVSCLCLIRKFSSLIRPSTVGMDGYRLSTSAARKAISGGIVCYVFEV